MEKFEYKYTFRSIKVDKVISYLNSEGNEGWEVVKFNDSRLGVDWGHKIIQVLFKRKCE